LKTLVLIIVLGVGLVLAAGSFIRATPKPHAMAAWEGQGFLTSEDAKALGADSEILYRREGPAHFYRFGRGGLEVKIWPYAEEAAAIEKLSSESEQKSVQPDGWAVVTLPAREGKFFFKVLAAIKGRDLAEPEARARAAVERVRSKLTSKPASSPQ
jgi:hypothetical protein